jgi:hypothetical protein
MAPTFQCASGTTLSHEILRGDNCFDLTLQYEVTAENIFNTNTEKTCAESSSLDIGDVMTICVEETEPTPPDTFECDGEESSRTVGSGDNCYDVSVEFDVTFADIYNSNTGKTCVESDTWDVLDVLRICKVAVTPPDDDYTCNGQDLGSHSVVSGDNCDALSLRYGVGYAEIFNVNTGQTCSENSQLQIDDVLRICKAAELKAVAAAAFQCDGEVLSHEVLRGDNCYDLTVQYEVTAADVFNTATEKTCAESSSFDIGDMLEICIQEIEPPTDNFECDSGIELDSVTVGAGDNCFDVSVQFDVQFQDIYNANTGLYCSESDVWDVSDVLRICKRSTIAPTSPPDTYICAGEELDSHVVVSGDNCYALSVRYNVNYADIYNVNSGLTCSQSAELQLEDVLRICQTAGAVVA